MRTQSCVAAICLAALLNCPNIILRETSLRRWLQSRDENLPCLTYSQAPYVSLVDMNTNEVCSGCLNAKGELASAIYQQKYPCPHCRYIDVQCEHRDEYYILVGDFCRQDNRPSTIWHMVDCSDEDDIDSHMSLLLGRPSSSHTVFRLIIACGASDLLRRTLVIRLGVDPRLWQQQTAQQYSARYQARAGLTPRSGEDFDTLAYYAGRLSSRPECVLEDAFFLSTPCAARPSDCRGNESEHRKLGVERAAIESKYWELEDFVVMPFGVQDRTSKRTLTRFESWSRSTISAMHTGPVPTGERDDSMHLQKQWLTWSFPRLDLTIDPAIRVRPLQHCLICGIRQITY